jgi:excisionase family DNA binding protein
MSERAPIPYKPGILPPETIAVIVVGIWQGWENAICFDGVDQYYCKVSQDRRICTQRLLPYNEQWDWMIKVLSHGYRLEPGPAAPAWRGHFALMPRQQITSGQPGVPKMRMKEAAKLLGIGLSTLKVKIRRGEIGVERLGPRTVYIYCAEIESYLRRKNAPRLAI